MELKNDFVVDRPVSETWKILTNLELIAPCLPGARLEEVEGDEYRGSVSVKVGPITGRYKGKAHFVEQDEANRVAKLKAEGRDPRQGNANAMITAAMVPAGPDGTQTRVDLTTDLGLSGKIASFARGNLEDVSRKLLGQFATNLEAMLADQGGAAPDATGTTEASAAEPAAATPSGTPGAEAPVAASGDASLAADVVAAADSETGAATTVGAAGGAESTPGTITEPGGSDRAPTASPASAASGVDVTPTAAPAEAPTTPAPPTVRRIDAPEAKPVDLLAVAGADTMAKKLAPLAVLVALLVLVRWLRRRS